MRRFEVLAALRFNDGTTVPDAVVADTPIEFEVRFAAVSCEAQTIRWPLTGDRPPQERARSGANVYRLGAGWDRG